ncbi:hypothetical protein OH76DRAFT_540101 [Lentinus brumalis]|uniref:Uncharacterized protein n=1 Tax=Lentinus brumalis TaxID=2498619 RepID=A0A371D9K9_9APHY|nr:hypothetical protein OH76DRAFT_540101 [Polyporus brumalis]
MFSASRRQGSYHWCAPRRSPHEAAAETKECVKGSGPSRKIMGLFLKDPLTKPGSDHERGRDPWPSPLPGPRHGTGDGEPADELDVGGSMKSEAIGPIGPSTKSGESAERSAAADGLGSTPLLAEGRRFRCVGRVPNAKTRSCSICNACDNKRGIDQ